MPKVFELSYSEMLAVRDFYHAWRREHKKMFNTRYWSEVLSRLQCELSEEDFYEFLSVDNFGQSVELSLDEITSSN